MQRLVVGLILLLVFIPFVLPVRAGGRCPEDMVWITSSATCLDLYEWPNKKGARPAVAMSAVSSPFDKEKGLVMDAETLCASVGKRPCEFAEWVPACRGPRGSDYPFGSKLPDPTGKPEDAPCNYARQYIQPDEMKVFERNPKELERLNQSDLSGARGCVSASGAHDMMGNVEEWIHCPKTLSATGWCLAGRYWSGPEPCSKVIVSHAPSWHYYETGFRCCLTPP